MSIRPNFLLIGAAKCGSTSLYQSLKRHPRVGACRVKEPNFFCFDDNYARGWDWYESLFSHNEGKTAIGEASMRYTQMHRFPNALPRIARDLPDARLIYLVRHPLRQIESHYLETWKRFDNVPPFNTLIVEEPFYIDTASYWRQIDAYRRHYPDERILVLFFEDFVADPAATLRRCFTFLGVDAEVAIDLAVQPAWNVSLGQVGQTRWSRLLRRTPGFRWWRRLTPAPLRRMVKKAVTRQITERPRWSPEVRAFAVDRLTDDAARLLAFYGKPANYWTWED